MRYILIATLLFSSLAYAQDPLRVVGEGPTLELAKQDGFKKAIEYVVGSAVVINIENQNYNNIRNEELLYSAGYIDKYKILKTTSTDDYYSVVMDIWVSSSKIQDRILSNPESKEPFQSDRHSAQYQTYMKERYAGDNLISSVLNDYPHRAFDLKLYPYKIFIEQDRRPYLHIPYKLHLSKNYGIAYAEAIKVVSDGKLGILGGNAYEYFTIENSPVGKKYYFNDKIRADIITSYFTENEPRLVLEIKDSHNQIIANSCYYTKISYAHYIGRMDFALNSYREESGELVLALPDKIDTISDVKVKVDSKINCR